MWIFPPFLPALLLALLASWCGTLQGGATAAGGTAAVALLLAMSATTATTGTPWRDPLALGRAGRLLPLALWLWVALSWWASPVRRAGTVGLILLPAFLLLPAALARCWREERDRRIGLRALAGVVAGVALWALGDEILFGASRAAMPLGHHTLLAFWLVTLAPIAALPARETGRWRFLGLGAGIVAVAAVLASRSLLGIVGLVAEGVVGVALARKRRAGLPSPGEGRAGDGRGAGGEGHRRLAGLGLLLLLALAAILQAPRLAGILSGRDVSARARSVYWAAGWQGFLARPIQGWGPGAAAWTNARFLRPVPGVNPPGETVGELHSLPLQMADELGVPGLLLALAVAGLFLVRRACAVRRAADPGLLLASVLGLGGAGVAALGTANLAVAALPWAVGTAAGGALAAVEHGRTRTGTDLHGRWEEWWARGAVRLYALIAVLALTPGIVAQWWYDHALAAESAGRRAEAVRALDRAVRLDPAFPLYRMRLALLRNEPELALRAAEDGGDVAALWTVAGILGQAAQRPWAPAALERACADDPLSPFPPFFRMQADPRAAGAGRAGARALLAAPELAAAVVWEGREELYATALREVRAWPGIDPGWKEAFLSVAEIPAIAPPDRRGEPQWIALTFDTDPRESISVPLFRRRPWPTRWPLVPVRRGLLERLALPAPTTLATTGHEAFSPAACVTTASPVRRRAVTWQPLRSR
jgi:O-antigen ligase